MGQTEPVMVVPLRDSKGSAWSGNAISWKRKKGKEDEDDEAHTSAEKVELERERSMRPRITS